MFIEIGVVVAENETQILLPFMDIYWVDRTPEWGCRTRIG